MNWHGIVVNQIHMGTEPNHVERRRIRNKKKKKEITTLWFKAYNWITIGLATVNEQ